MDEFVAWRLIEKEFQQHLPLQKMLWKNGHHDQGITIERLGVSVKLFGGAQVETLKLVSNQRGPILNLFITCSAVGLSFLCPPSDSVSPLCLMT